MEHKALTAYFNDWTGHDVYLEIKANLANYTGDKYKWSGKFMHSYLQHHNYIQLK